MEKVNLEFLARQLDRLINEVADLKDEVAVLLAKVERLEATSNILAAETRAMQNRYERRTKRVDGLEDRDYPEVP